MELVAGRLMLTGARKRKTDKTDWISKGKKLKCTNDMRPPLNILLKGEKKRNNSGEKQKDGHMYMQSSPGTETFAKGWM